ncbi:MAG: hypothetical protein QUT30_13880 [Acidobacteriota bacterium]|jgi:hypothetical protein|nr:hypothetical protein [Acidobacteriota bacterium]
MYPILGCSAVLVRLGFPEGQQDLEEMHSALAANRAEIKGLPGEGFVAGFAIEDLRIGTQLRGMKHLAA